MRLVKLEIFLLEVLLPLLSTLLNQKVDITTPEVSLIIKSMLSDEFPHPYVAIQVYYTQGFTGSNLLVIKQSMQRLLQI